MIEPKTLNKGEEAPCLVDRELATLGLTFSTEAMARLVRDRFGWARLVIDNRRAPGVEVRQYADIPVAERAAMSLSELVTACGQGQILDAATGTKNFLRFHENLRVAQDERGSSCATLR